MRFAALLLVLIALLAGAGGFVLKTATDPFEPAPGRKEIIEVEKGTPPASISRDLESKGLIRSASLFRWLGRFRGDWTHVKAGEYEISSSMTGTQILDILRSGVSVMRPLLVREGENIYEIAARVQEKGWGKSEDFLRLARDPQFISTLKISAPMPESLEGFLFPDTYQFARKTSQEEIIRTMVRRFLTLWGEKEEQRAAELGMNRNQIITLASIVEKETGAPGERFLISGVFHNRLRKKMRLQSDPTTIYGIWTRYSGNIRKQDLLEPTPYNTYTIPALPIGPISNPGIDAIQATLNPENHDFLYFVSRNDGTHEFTATFKDHNQAVKRFQLNPVAREGKSWRDLKKKKAASNRRK